MGRSTLPSATAELVRTARPRQWVKNLLVFAAPGAAGVLDNGEALANTVIAFGAFCLAASGTYFVNDLVDREADRQHPIKRDRPIAAGQLSGPVAAGSAAILIAGGIGLSFVAHWHLAVVVASYVGLTTAYSLWLKHIVIVDVVTVAAGFVLRAIGGAAATGVPISNWFFIVTSFGSLFVVVGKRQGETLALGTGGETRATLAEYSDTYLAYLRTMSSGLVLVAYCLWAFEKADLADNSTPWFQLSIVPFALAVLRYALILDRGGGAAPEELFFRDRALQAATLGWAIVFGAGVYLT